MEQSRPRRAHPTASRCARASSQPCSKFAGGGEARHGAFRNGSWCHGSRGGAERGHPISPPATSTTAPAPAMFASRIVRARRRPAAL